MKTHFLSALTVAALLASGGAAAQNLRMSTYLGASGGVSSWNADCAGTTDCKKNPGSLRIFAGMDIVPNVALELTYASLGKLKATAAGVPIDIRGDSFDLSGVYKFGSDYSSLGAFVKGGVAYTNAKSTVAGVSDTKKAWGLLLGAGMTYALTPNVALRAEIDTQNVKVPGGTSGNVTSFSVGGQASF
ncbi:MAG: hypothetical protein RLZZ401_839 [Pseudomonadota bacterium]